MAGEAPLFTKRRDTIGIRSIATAGLVAALVTLAAVPAQALDVRDVCTLLGICEPPQQEGKVGCRWTHTGANVPIGTPGVPPGTSYVTQIITIHCPHHIELGGLQYGWKDCVDPLTGGPCTTLGENLHVDDLGRTDDDTGCGWSRSWSVYAPNFNLYRAWFRVHTLKDADCDKKPDDWNHDRFNERCGREYSECPGLFDAPEADVWRQNNDGSVVNYGDGALEENPCYYHNTFYAGRDVFEKPSAAGGIRDPRQPGYAPAPDREVNECDWQNWEYQWRQYN